MTIPLSIRGGTTRNYPQNKDEDYGVDATLWANDVTSAINASPVANEVLQTDYILGSAGQVASGLATHTTLSAILAVASDGDSVYVLTGTYSYASILNINKRLTIINQSSDCIHQSTAGIASGAILKFSSAGSVFKGGQIKANAGTPDYAIEVDADDVYIETQTSATFAITPLLITSGSLTIVAFIRDSTGTVVYPIPFGGANSALSNLAGVNINTTLVSDTNNNDDLGTDAIEWKDAWLHNIKHNDAGNPNLTISTTGNNGDINVAPHGTGIFSYNSNEVIDESILPLPVSGDEYKFASVKSDFSGYELLDGFFYIKATDDGVTDVSGTIQAQVTAAGSNRTIIFPKPAVAYRIDTPIDFLTGQKVIGESGYGVEIRDYTTDYCFRFIGGAGVPADAKVGFEISGFTFKNYNASLGAIKLKNVYLGAIRNIIVSDGTYKYTSTNVLYLEDFFNITVDRVQINSNTGSVGLYANALNGANSGQLQITNSLFQRCKNGIFIEAQVGGFTDGVTLIGNGIGANTESGVKIRNNVSSVSFINNHIENHDGGAPEGDTGVDMQATANVEGVSFYSNYFINNKYAIKSDYQSRTQVVGNQFDANSIATSVAITQGANDVGWFIGTNQFTTYATDITEAGTNHRNLYNVFMTKAGFISLAGSVGIYFGSGSPESAITAPVGSIYLRTNGASGTLLYNKLTGTGNTGWVADGYQTIVFTDGTRPSPSVGIGFVIYNTDDNAPNWSDGTNWRLADGSIT